MISQSLFIKCVLIPKNINFCRHLRSIAPRKIAPKLHSSPPRLIEGKVKTITQYDESEDSFESYKDFIKSIERSKLGNELEVEQHFLNDDYHGDVFERTEMYYDMHLKESKEMKSSIKKKIIGRKYFKLDKETNLLTHAAKEQIRYLHKSNPLEWNYKRLSECFPISENGVKKLLKCNFVLTCPKKIKLHDEGVARRWEILKSGKPSDEIYPLTQKLYEEGKLVDDYFSGNPNLPSLPLPKKTVIEVKKQEEVGEFSAIVKTYFDYTKQKLIESGKENTSEKQVSLRDPIKSKRNIKNVRKFKYEDEENDDANPQVYPTQIRKIKEDGEIPFSQFKEILKDETSLKLKSKYKNEYDDFVMQSTSKRENNLPQQPQDGKNCFLKIPKYNNDNLMYEKKKNANVIYKYDEKLGYQYPHGKSIKGKINVSPKRYKNGKLYKVGSCVYDADGEFLYSTP